MTPVLDDAKLFAMSGRYPGPGPRDWALLVVNAAFVLAGLALLGRNLGQALTTLTFFGACFAMALANVLQKRRFSGYRITRAHLVGGVRMRPSRTKASFSGLVLFTVGIVPLAFDVPAPVHVRALLWCMALGGAGLTVAVAMDKAPVGFLQFDPPSITVGYRGYALVIPWDSISGFAEGEAARHPALFILLRDASKLQVVPSHASKRAAQSLVTTRSYYGADLCVLPGRYGLDLPLLMRALERYLNEPSTRGELGVEFPDRPLPLPPGSRA